MANNTQRFHWKTYKPALYTLLFFVVLLIIAYYYSSYRRGQWEKDVRSGLLEELIDKKSKLEKSLSSRVYYSKGVAAFVSIHPEITDNEFCDYVGKVIGADSVISTMSIAKGGTINAIYPIKGHEAAIGLNLMQHPKRRKIVEKTIETGKTFIAGPVNLVEGGVAFISYTPIFNTTPEGERQFWGVTDIVIDKDKLISDAGLVTTEHQYNFALKGENGTGEDGSVFWGDSTIFAKDPVTISIVLPTGSWILAAVPVIGWAHFLDQDKTLSTALFFCCLVISLLFYLVVNAQLKINANESQLKAIFRSMQNLIIEFSDEGEYISIPDTNKSLLYRAENELIGKKVTEIFEPEMAAFLMNAIQECLHKKDLVEIEYPLEIKGKKSWFSARLSYKSENRVILNAYDITDRKLNEETLRASEQYLMQANSLKDKFFSIVAHDLRNPVGSFKMLTGIMLEEFESVEPARTKKMLSSIHLASSSLHDLLENLLSWSHTQRRTLVISKRVENLYDLCDDAIDSQLAHANVKKIYISNEVDEDSMIFCDPFISLTIIRNLISNAIKFTPEEGQIKVSAEIVTADGQSYQSVSVTDNGRGISAERLKVILNSKASDSTPGTFNEMGTGLGLMLCREFVDKQDGLFEIISQENRGTTVIFRLPFPADFTGQN